jgi:hypothetical protein
MAMSNGWRKFAVWVGILATIPTAFVAGFFLADRFYVRFLFEGDIKDFAPGDALGVFLYGSIFTVVILVLTCFGWWRVYRKVRQSATRL